MTKIPLFGLKRKRLIRFFDEDSIFEVSATKAFSNHFGQNAEIRKMEIFAQNWHFLHCRKKASRGSHIADLGFFRHSEQVENGFFRISSKKSKMRFKVGKMIFLDEKSILAIVKKFLWEWVQNDFFDVTSRLRHSFEKSRKMMF